MGRCNIKHGFHDGRCIREKGHDGYCRCKAEKMAGGSIMYSEWISRDGQFYRHHQYKTIYPKNATGT